MRDLKDIQVCDKAISFKEGDRFFARDGVLYEQIIAGNIKVLCETNSISNESIEDFICFENEKNKVDMESMIKSKDFKAYKDVRNELNDLKNENLKLKKEIETIKKLSGVTEDENDVLEDQLEDKKTKKKKN